jgi:Raf kinase inhibitor-like YbhB/YbcL family protein
MLEKIPPTLGRAAQRVRAGAEDLAVADTELTGVNASIEVGSEAFGYNQPIPPQYTADGEGLSPPLEWHGVPMNAEAVVVLIEDADSPTPRPLVHAIVWDLPGSDASLPEGALPSARAADNSAASQHLGRNSALSATWLPPDPPPGHGAHRYVFQVFALDCVLRFESRPGRTELLDRIKGHVIAKGLLIGTYERT